MRHSRRRGRPGRASLRLLVGVVLALSSIASSSSAPLASARAASQCFVETGFCIDDPMFQEYFRLRGQTRILGFPISRVFTLDGFSVQFFQRVVLQRQGNTVSRLNLLDPGLMPLLHAGGLVLPPPDPALAAVAPNNPDDPRYAEDVANFIRRVAPDNFNGKNVGFFQLFASTVPVDIAFPQGQPNPTLITLLNLEIWGLPTSAPTPDPTNGNFIYQRFQRGIMHYDATCPCTQGILVGDLFKSVLTGRDLPADLARDMLNSRYYGQYAPGNRGWLARPTDLTNTDLTGAFQPGTDPPRVLPRIRLDTGELPTPAVLSANGLRVEDINTSRTVTFAQPQASGVVVSIAPLTRPPTSDSTDLMQRDAGVAIGVLVSPRSLTLPQVSISRAAAQQPNTLPQGAYVVRVRRGQVEFAGQAGTVPGPAADIHGMTRWVGPPQATATYKDVCFAWNQVQVCTAPSPLRATGNANAAMLTDPMARAVETLTQRGVLGNASINVDATVGEAEGQTATNARAGSVLAAPIKGPNGPQTAPANEGATVGALVVVQTVDVPGVATLPPATYAVQVGPLQAQGRVTARLKSADGQQVEIPSRLVEVRGGSDEPLVSIGSLCFLNLCLPEDFAF